MGLILTNYPPLSRRFNEAVLAIKEGRHSDAGHIVRRINEELIEAHPDVRNSKANTELLRKLAELVHMEIDARPISKRVGVINGDQSGRSIVSCARNRTENLMGALPTWLEHETINEIIIVDWSS